MKEFFNRFAAKTSQFAGSPGATVFAFVTIIIWFMGGPHYKWSDSYQILINTGTTIVNFLMCFLIQASQNRTQEVGERENKALHLKLDEILRSQADARNEFRGIEKSTSEELERLAKEEKCQ